MTFKKLFYLIFCITIAFCFTTTAHAQTSSLRPAQAGNDPWSQSQLLEPVTLATQLKANSEHAVILNMGTVEDIKDARHIGTVRQEANLELLTKEVSSFPKNTELIIYCGCCPLYKCPNIRPAFLELKKLGFTNVKVLNLQTNLQTNWIKEGYPLATK